MQEKILRATAKIIADKGIKAASTRAICAAARITAPTLYHYFHDKTELIEAVSNLAFESHREHKNKNRVSKDPINCLRQSWDNYMDFALKEPELHLTMMSSLSHGKIAEAGHVCFGELISEFERVQELNLLKYSVIESSGIYLGAAQGISMALLSKSKSKLWREISQTMRDSILAGLVIS